MLQKALEHRSLRFVLRCLSGTMKAVTYCQTVATQSDSGKRYNLLKQFGRLPLVGRLPHHRRSRTPCRSLAVVVRIMYSAFHLTRCQVLHHH